MMKKILASLAISSVLVTTSFASVNKEEAGLYKAITLSRAKIEKDFADGQRVNSILNNFFITLRANRDIEKVNILNSRVEKMIDDLNKKWVSATDKNYNLILNIYYRNKLLKDFHLKWVTTNNDSNSKKVVVTGTETTNKIITGNDSNKNIITGNNNNNNVIITWNSNNNNNNNSISNIISKWDVTQNTGTNTTKNETKSLSYTYMIPANWTEQKAGQGETILTSSNNEKDSVVMLITSYNNSFSDYANDFKAELRKDASLRNFSESNTTLNGKTAVKFSYNLSNEDSKTIYLAEYNGMILVVNATKKAKNNSSENINEIINSIKIDK